MQILSWFLVLGIVCLAGLCDWRSRRIPNWLTVPSLLTGLLFHFVFGGWSGGKSSLEGAGLALGLLLPFVLLRGLGAGDWKLMGALGAWLGPGNLFLVLLVTILVAGIMAMIQVIQARRIKETFANMWTLTLALVTFGVRSNPITLDNPGLLKLPFGVAAAVATVLLFCAEWIQRYRF